MFSKTVFFYNWRLRLASFWLSGVVYVRGLQEDIYQLDEILTGWFLRSFYKWKEGSGLGLAPSASPRMRAHPIVNGGRPPAKGNDGHGPHCKHFASTTEQIRHNGRESGTEVDMVSLSRFSSRFQHR